MKLTALALLGVASAADKIAEGKSCKAWDACIADHNCANYDVMGLKKAVMTKPNEEKDGGLDDIVDESGLKNDDTFKKADWKEAKESALKVIQGGLDKSRQCVAKAKCGKKTDAAIEGLIMKCMTDPAASGAKALGATLIAAIAVVSAM